MTRKSGSRPSYENVRDGQYAFYRPLYLVTHQTIHRVRPIRGGAPGDPGQPHGPPQGDPDLMSTLVIYGFGVK
jgi:hypothetical protein